ncbi:hypothetical protein MASR1M60_08140 [Rhodocyclaceae bacterium]
MEMSDQAKQMQQLISKYRADESLNEKLIPDSTGTLKAESVEVRAVENTTQQSTLVTPPKPDELTDEALVGVAGGIFNSVKITNAGFS